MTKPRPDDGERGFTLVEVLVSLALIVLLLALLPNAVGLGRRAWETHEDASAQIARKAQLSILEQRLAEALPQFDAVDQGLAVIAFAGELDALEFVAPGPGPVSTGLQRWRLSVAGAPGQPRIEANVRPTQSAQAATAPLFAIDGATLRLAYFGRAQPNDPPVWHERWPRTDALPLLVEITLMPHHRRQHVTHRLVVALRLATS